MPPRTGRRLTTGKPVDTERAYITGSDGQSRSEIEKTLGRIDPNSPEGVRLIRDLVGEVGHFF